MYSKQFSCERLKRADFERKIKERVRVETKGGGLNCKKYSKIAKHLPEIYSLEYTDEAGQ